MLAISVEEVPVEAHISIGKLDRYHGPLRRAYEVRAEDIRGSQVDAPYIPNDPDPEWYDAASFKNRAITLQKYHDETPSQQGPPLR